MVILRQTGNVIGVGGKCNNFKGYIDQVISLKKNAVCLKYFFLFYSENLMNEIIIRISFIVNFYKGKLYL